MTSTFHRTAGVWAFALLACKPGPNPSSGGEPGTKPPVTEPPVAPPTTERKALTAVVSELGRGYRVKAPAGSEPRLGHRWIDQQPETNACFLGVPHDAPSGGWDHIEVAYDVGTVDELRDVFGSLLRIPLDVGASWEVGLVLDDIRESSLDRIYFTTDGNCAADFETSETNTYPVITRALKAESIEISGDLAASANVDAAKLGGNEVDASSARVRRWEGANLFFAVFVECLSVTARATRCENEPVGHGNTCDLETCSFQVETRNPETNQWTGTLSCSGGPPIPLAGLIGQKAPPKAVADGVSYSVQVLKSSWTGLVTIVLKRWTVGTATAPDACAP